MDRLYGKPKCLNRESKRWIFSLGSTKVEVVNAMGTPTSFSIYGNEWGYGGSTIEFDENDVVIDWTDYLEKLRIK